jgi:hypothetical protein
MDLIVSGCPTCKRTFCDKAYDRHVSFCSNKFKQVQQTPSEETLLARLKLDRRIKFAAHRTATTSANTSAVMSISKQQTHLTSVTMRQQVPLPTSTMHLLTTRKNNVNVLARCPWCSKPYMPNCIHYCRNSKDLVSIHSK